MKIKTAVLVKRIDGGTGTFTIDLLNHKFKNVSLFAYVLERPSYRAVRKSDVCYFPGESIYPEKYYPSLNVLNKITKEILWFSKMLNKQKYDVIFCIDPHCLLVASLAKILSRRNNLRLFCSIHNNIRGAINDKSIKILHSPLKILFRHFLNTCNQIICVSNDLSQDVKRYFNLGITPITIYNGIKIDKKVKPRKLKNGERIILSVGRFNEQKDYINLVKAFLLLPKLLSNTLLYLVGDGPLKESIINFVLL